ncbi:MAG: hypothetical protein JWL76_1386 [Thermoleophilia bacterium]|nr:hypothetical protein [Thermoleophilia bacterium]
MAAKKARKRAYIPPTVEVVNRKERTTSAPRVQRTQAARGGKAGARAQYEYPKPSFRRTAKRLPIYFVLIFALQYWFAGQDSRGFDTQERLIFAAGSAAFVTALFAPFMHIMDKFAYNRYLRKTGQQPTADTKS